MGIPHIIPQFPWTSLHEAAYNGHTDIAKYLVAHGANARAMSKVTSPLHLFHPLPPQVGNTPFMVAARFGHPEIVSFLMPHALAAELVKGRKEGDQKSQATWFSEEQRIGCVESVRLIDEERARRAALLHPLHSLQAAAAAAFVSAVPEWDWVVDTDYPRFVMDALFDAQVALDRGFNYAAVERLRTKIEREMEESEAKCARHARK